AVPAGLGAREVGRHEDGARRPARVCRRGAAPRAGAGGAPDDHRDAHALRRPERAAGHLQDADGADAADAGGALRRGLGRRPARAGLAARHSKDLPAAPAAYQPAATNTPEAPRRDGARAAAKASKTLPAGRRRARARTVASRETPRGGRDRARRAACRVTGAGGHPAPARPPAARSHRADPVRRGAARQAAHRRRRPRAPRRTHRPAVVPARDRRGAVGRQAHRRCRPPGKARVRGRLLRRRLHGARVRSGALHQGRVRGCGEGARAGGARRLGERPRARGALLARAVGFWLGESLGRVGQYDRAATELERFVTGGPHPLLDAGRLRLGWWSLAARRAKQSADAFRAYLTPSSPSAAPRTGTERDWAEAGLALALLNSD